ncbi:hypothetical protein EDB92DRAFT_1937150 [Lactarius akahatsu]|uniref:Guanylate-binding protein N-terminal domain-containing protein n=1 Tax=Lactarius akahatsu TaxID=416441 RepID=A0AAD4L4W0_9AGAM|nr:hypothetical protein EDB92DRAFT_1937150 [Lactarius akahatsu]
MGDSSSPPLVLAAASQSSTAEKSGTVATEPAPPPEDPSCPIKGMYRLLDLITEQGSSGLVDKIVIAQESLQAFINALSPGAYSSITRVNFKILDYLLLKPIGVYGSREEIVRFLREMGAIDVEMCVNPSGAAIAQEQTYVLYWPEDTTWDDNAVSTVQRNRVTFMRYLTKLCDQLVCLLSTEHSQAIVWGDEVDDMDDASLDSENDDSDRLYDFMVAKTNEQEENVIARQGFTMNSSRLVNQPPPPNMHIDPSILSPRLLYGETTQGFMTADFRPARATVEPFSHDHQSASQIRLLFEDDVVLCLSETLEDKALKTLMRLGLSTRFPEEYEAWEKGRVEIEKRFQKLLSRRQAEVHVNLEQNSGEIRAKVRESVIGEILRAFPMLRRDGFSSGSRSADSINSGEATDFQFKKERLLILYYLLENYEGLSASQTRSLGDAVLVGRDKQKTLGILKTFAKGEKGGWFSVPWGNKKSPLSKEEAMWRSANNYATTISDSRFLAHIKTIPVNDFLHDAAVECEETAYDCLATQLDSLVSGISQQILSTQKDECDRQVQREVKSDEEKELKISRAEFVRQIEDLCRERSRSAPVRVRKETLQNQEVEYKIHILRLLADQKHNLQLDPSYVPVPVLNERLSQSFHVPSETVVKYAHLLEGDRILLGLVDAQGNVMILLDRLSRIDATIQSRSYAKFFHQDKIGQTCLIAFDESKRMPASLQLPRIPRAIYSAPDGSCVLIVQDEHGERTITAYHWSTFASTRGISVTLPDFPVDLDAALLTSIVNRNNINFVGLDLDTRSCRSVILDITRKATEFTFQERRSKGSGRHGKQTVHNSLIDCHSDVWTRFPVVPAVKRHTITSSSQRQRKTLVFVTDDHRRPFSSHFSDIISAFEKTSRKPTGDELKSIVVSARPFPSFTQQFLSSPDWPVTRFRAGEWLADLLCLIPIHIAITHENRFVPLKDGVVSPQLEKSLLGAEVNRIVDSLSLGWYESIFQSYWASKPVKVVSSMGEQSVGKSFTLNHLVDTSFAGSAMRTTEGVWMSVSPTEDALIVALDFEGVHSLERSAQEDTLLVLFNTAISNLVLFRNNFALSRDISGLFQSFQSSSSVLDPASNPSLFQSTLVVIIKDVIDSDKAEVTREFALKFQKIVQDEQDANFITRLHAGKLQIIPWPVIESREFYRLFSAVKKKLDQQRTSHNTAGEFLHTLKTLMAKLKANDWGAMSQTMAAHRANSLLAILPVALETGYSEVVPEIEPLKRQRPDMPAADREHRLSILRDSWDRAGSRQHVDDSEWISDLVQYLTRLVDLRVGHVDKWLKSNIQRFQAEHASIEELRRTFNSAVIDLRAGVQLCKSQCADCNLFCIQGRFHEGDHDCLTSHECVHDCTFCNQELLAARICGQT